MFPFPRCFPGGAAPAPRRAAAAAQALHAAAEGAAGAAAAAAQCFGGEDGAMGIIVTYLRIIYIYI